MSRISIFFILLAFIFPLTSWAHQPRLVESRLTEVIDPEISKAYYGELQGEPDVYIIDAEKNFNLYVNILVPDILDQKKDVSAVVLYEGAQLALLDGMNFTWQKFYEPFGADTYLMGPEYEQEVGPGRYEIRVWSSNNDSKYSLAIGKIEAFDGKEGINALTIIPKLKKDFFGSSSISFIKSPFGWGLILVMYVGAFIVGFVYRKLVVKIAVNSPRGLPKNIGTKDRVLRFVIAIGLLLWAINTSWSPIVIFFSGFAFFEAIFSWCGFYTLFGKNTCPVA